MSFARLALIGLLFLLVRNQAWPCTTFCLVNQEHIVFGRNYDYYMADGRVMVNRRGIQKTDFDTNSGVRWVSRFGSLTFNQFGYEFPTGGINEAGLVVEQMSLAGTRYANDDRPALGDLQWIQYQLDCCATVEEVLASDQHIRLTTDSSAIHFLVADRSGRCAVMEYLEGRLVVHADSALPVAALTNHTYEASLAYAAATQPAQADHVSSLGRFVHAAAAVRNFPQSAAADPIAYAFDTLATVAQPTWTRWSIAYDIGNREVYFRTQPSPAIKRVRLNRIDFRPTAPLRMIDINTSVGGEVVPEWIYSQADNLAVMTAVFRGTTPFAYVSAAYLQWRAAYPDSNRPAALPVISVQPESRVIAVGEPVELSVAASVDATVQWQQNGRRLTGASRPTLRIESAQPGDAGLYTAVLSNAVGTVVSEPAIVGVTTAAKVIGEACEYAADIHHVASGNTYDQFLLTGSAASLTADPGQVARISFIDLSEDIVQVEFSGPGTLTLRLDGGSGPAPPRKYNQDVPYMRGHATVILSGAAATTHVAIYSVGAVTNPAVIRAGASYDGHADLAALAIQSGEGRLAEIRCGNAAFSGSAGPVGILAPGVTITPGPVNVHDVCAGDTAAGYLVFESVPLIRISGGDLWQLNGGAIKPAGVPSLGILLAAGTSSANVPEPSRPLRGRIERDGLDVSGELVTRELPVW